MVGEKRLIDTAPAYGIPPATVPDSPPASRRAATDSPNPGAADALSTSAPSPPDVRPK